MSNLSNISCNFIANYFFIDTFDDSKKHIDQSWTQTQLCHNICKNMSYNIGLSKDLLPAKKVGQNCGYPLRNNLQELVNFILDSC